MRRRLFGNGGGGAINGNFKLSIGNTGYKPYINFSCPTLNIIDFNIQEETTSNVLLNFSNVEQNSNVLFIVDLSHISNVIVPNESITISLFLQDLNGIHHDIQNNFIAGEVNNGVDVKARYENNIDGYQPQYQRISIIIEQLYDTDMSSAGGLFSISSTITIDNVLSFNLEVSIMK